MTRTAAALAILCCLGRAQAQDTETYVLRHTVSNRETIVYTRVIEFDRQKGLFHVRDYFENGRLQMDAFYTSFDKQVKEDDRNPRSGVQRAGVPIRDARPAVSRTSQMVDR